MPGERFTRVFVTVDTSLVILLAFAFGFGNGWTTALRLGVSPWIAPLAQPAVDLAVVGLMIALRYLSIHGFTDAELSMPRWWLRFFGLLTMAMNTALPLGEHHFSRAAWDAIGPILLIAWSELAPWLLRAIYTVRAQQTALREEYAPADPPEVREIPQQAVSAPPPRTGGAVIDISAANLRTSVRHYCLEWHKERRDYQGVIGSVYARVHPVYAGEGRKLTRRRVAQLCLEEWDDLHATGRITSPRPA